MCKCFPSKPDNLTSFLRTQAKGLSDVALTCNPVVYGEMSKADVESSGSSWACNALGGCTANKGDSESKTWKVRVQFQGLLTSIQASLTPVIKL